MDLEPCVFVVDDEGISLRAVERLLRSHGYSVLTFSSPKAFLEQLPYPGPACLVLDMSVPELTGLEAQDSMAYEAMPLPTVFLSGASDVRGTAQAMRKGAMDFLVKPVDDIAFLESVSRALTASAEISSPPPRNGPGPRTTRAVDEAGAPGLRPDREGPLEQADCLRARHQ